MPINAIKNKRSPAAVNGASGGNPCVIHGNKVKVEQNQLSTAPDLGIVVECTINAINHNKRNKK